MFVYLLLTIVSFAALIVILARTPLQDEPVGDLLHPAFREQVAPHVARVEKALRIHGHTASKYFYYYVFRACKRLAPFFERLASSVEARLWKLVKTVQGHHSEERQGATSLYMRNLASAGMSAGKDDR